MSHEEREYGAQHLLDARGLKCPLPIMKTGTRLRDVPAGETLRVLATDPGAPSDFEDFCRAAGHELLEARHEDGAYAFLIRRRG
jgi:tRNA 2-thiouridine synthesizing protein A